MTTQSQKFVADLSKCYPAAYQSVLDGVLELAKAHGVAPGDLIFVAREDQIVPAAIAPNKRTVAGTSYNAWLFALPLVKGILEQLAQEGVRSVILASFSAPVLNLKLNPPGGIQIADVFLGALRGDRPTASQAGSVSYESVEWSFPVPFEDARKLLLFALVKNGCTSAKSAAWFTSVKPMMAELDNRFRGNAMSTNTQGMMSALVSRIGREGLIHTDATVKVNNKLVWLTLSGAVTANALMKEPAAATASVSVIEQKSDQQKETRPVSNEFPAAPTVPEEVNPPAEVQTSLEHAGEPAAKLSVAHGLAGNHPKRATRKGSPRSLQFQSVWEELDLGPFASYRDTMLAAMMVVPLDGDVKLRDLVKSAESGAVTALRQKGLNPDDIAHVPPWRRIKEFIIKVLTLSGAAWTEGNKLIPRSSMAGQMVVRRLDPACAKLVLAELVFALVSKLSDVNETDKPDMAFTLFHVAGDDQIGAVEEALGHLVEEHRIDEDARDGRIYYKVKTFPQSPSVPVTEGSNNTHELPIIRAGIELTNERNEPSYTTADVLALTGNGEASHHLDPTASGEG